MGALNLYYISQEANQGWDTWDSAVVCAETEEEAKHIHPGSEGDTNDYFKDWWQDTYLFGRVSSWTTPSNVRVRFIGTAHLALTRGVVCASFNAG